MGKIAKKNEICHSEPEQNWKKEIYRKFAKIDKEKAKIQRDKYQMSLFAMTPESEECKTFLKIEQLEAMIEAQIAQAMKKQQLLKLQQANKSE